MINEKRLVQEFMRLASIDSPSRQEGNISRYLKSVLQNLGADPLEDDAARSTGGEAGNIFGRLKGEKGLPAIILNAHMDTVSPGISVEPHIVDETILSRGETILGADDKSGIAIILEVLKVLKETGITHGDIEILFTVCEEVGLLGAKNFDVSIVEAEFGYTLDSQQSGSLTYAAPASNHIVFRIYGKESHAGIAPENGISAIQLAGAALSKMQLGRIDHETTANIGIIKGGGASNIIPAMVEMEGESRSHKMEKLQRQTDGMIKAVGETIKDFNANSNDGLTARWEVDVRLDYPALKLDSRCMAVSGARRTGKKLGIDVPLITGGGGSDINIFNDKGIEMANLGTGMKNVHTNNESIKINDMVKAAALLLEIVKAV